MTAPLTPDDLKAAFARARTSVFRLETLALYVGDEDTVLAAFRGGLPQPRSAAKDEWTSWVRRKLTEGCTVRRVHVVCEPLTEYLRFELTWSYEANVGAGEDVRILPVAPGAAWPDGVPRCDMWLFDDRALYVMRYDPRGVWTGVDHVTDSARVAAACRSRDVALRQSVPWRDYVLARPDLVSHLHPETAHTAS